MMTYGTAPAPVPNYTAPAAPQAMFVQQSPSYTPAPMMTYGTAPAPMPMASMAPQPAAAPGGVAYIQPSVPSYTPQPTVLTRPAPAPAPVAAIQALPMQETVLQETVLQQTVVQEDYQRAFAEDTSITVLPYYQVNQLDPFLEVCAQAIEVMKGENLCSQFGFTIGAGATANMAFCRAAFANADGVLSHFQALDSLLRDGL